MEMTSPAALPVVLFSGLAADDTLLAAQKSAFPHIIVPRWIPPAADDSLASYCQRFAESLRPLGRCVIGGASFGGVIAMEMARFLDPAAVLLIGSIRGPHQLPRRLALFRPLRPLVPLLPIWALRLSASLVSAVTGEHFLPHTGAIARQYRHVDTDLFRWSVRAGLAWNKPPVVRCPIFQIHGDRDRVLPIKYTQPDTIVRGAGHLVSMTHAPEVNAFIAMHTGLQAAPPALESRGEAASGLGG
jgi:pimeloyl-ACP methyl ester carboxylesterase